MYTWTYVPHFMQSIQMADWLPDWQTHLRRTMPAKNISIQLCSCTGPIVNVSVWLLRNASEKLVVPKIHYILQAKGVWESPTLDISHQLVRDSNSRLCCYDWRTEEGIKLSLGKCVCVCVVCALCVRVQGETEWELCWQKQGTINSITSTRPWCALSHSGTITAKGHWLYVSLCHKQIKHSGNISRKIF